MDLIYLKDLKYNEYVIKNWSEIPWRNRNFKTKLFDVKKKVLITHFFDC